MLSSLVTPDFTEARYEQLVLLAKEHYRFEPFGTACAEPHVLWRHDIDFSMHRAIRLAEIERAHDIRATYFLLLSSPYYSLFEAETGRLARALVGLGHHIGLHFDPTCHNDRRERDPVKLITRERQVLEDIVETEVSVMSFHNPAHAGLLEQTASHIAGLLNVYGGRVRSDYTYASDSGGFWRYRPIHEVLAAREHPRLHILTHPLWWCAEPLTSRRKVSRCVEGRAAAAQKFYDDLMRSAGMWETIMTQEKLAQEKLSPEEMTQEKLAQETQ